MIPWSLYLGNSRLIKYSGIHNKLYSEYTYKYVYV